MLPAMASHCLAPSLANRKACAFPTSLVVRRAVLQLKHRPQATKGQPATAAEVVSWAKQQFLQEVGKPDGSISLAKSCLLIALEEEAAAQLESAGPPGRTGATAATWSLQRLDALAAEVIDNLQQQHPQTIDSTWSLDEEEFRRSTQRSAKLHEKMRVLAHQYPMQVLMAVNGVLFGRHGYSACNRYGMPSDSQLATVLESGPGSCAALTVLYIEVCSRLGMNLDFRVVEDGRYILAWPRTDLVQRPLTAAGEACVLDVYGKGALLTVAEAAELFGLTEEQLFAGSSRRELLAALLGEQQHSHWCSAVGCSPQPIFMTPLSAATAVKQHVRQLNGLSIERATAAAEKRVALLPGDLKVQLELALLCYFSGRYEDAWLELGSYLEALNGTGGGSHEGDTGAGPAAGGLAKGAEQHPDPIAAANAAASIEALLMGSPAAQVASALTQAVSIATATIMASSEEARGEEVARSSKNDAAGDLADVLLLFEKLQLELIMHSPSPATA